MKKAVAIVAVILVLAGIGAAKNKADAKKAAETTVTVEEAAVTPRPTAKPTASPKPTAALSETAAPAATPEVVAIVPAAPADSAAPTRSVEQTYIINTNTGKFHKPTCSSVSQMKESNKKEFTGTRDDVVAMGYAPCGKCNP